MDFIDLAVVMSRVIIDVCYLLRGLLDDSLNGVLDFDNVSESEMFFADVCDVDGCRNWFSVGVILRREEGN